MNARPLPMLVAPLVALAVALGIGAAAAARDTDGDARAEVPAEETIPVARIVAAYVAPDEVVFEPAELVVGDEVVVRDGAGGRQTLPVAADVTVTVVDCRESCVEGAPADYDALTLAADGTSYHRLTVVDGMITAIDEVYVS